MSAILSWSQCVNSVHSAEIDGGEFSLKPSHVFKQSLHCPGKFIQVARKCKLYFCDFVKLHWNMCVWSPKFCEFDSILKTIYTRIRIQLAITSNHHSHSKTVNFTNVVRHVRVIHLGRITRDYNDGNYVIITQINSVSPGILCCGGLAKTWLVLLLFS